MATYQEQIERRRLEREAKEKAEALNASQVDNWRIVLANMGIPFARSMPAEMVQRFRDALQAKINAEYPPDAAHGEQGEKK